MADLNEDYRRMASGFIDGPSIAGLDPARLGMGPITEQASTLVPNNGLPLWQDLQRFDSGTITQAPQSFEQALAQFLQQEAAPQGASGPTAANGYYIPEFAQDRQVGPAPIPMNSSEAKVLINTAKAQKMGKDWGSQGFTFEVDPNTGQMTISNTEATRAAAQGLTSPTQTELMAPTNFRAAMQAIQAEQDPVARAQMFADLQTKAAAFKAQLWDKTMQQANNKLAVPELEARLAQNEALDRADPKWQQFQSDSPITAKLRAQLMQARSHADDEAKQMMGSNVTLASMDTQMKAAAGIFGRMEKLQDLKDQKQASAEDRLAAQKENLLFRQQLADEDLLQQTSPEMLQRMGQIDPSQANKPAIDVARYINKGVKDNATKEALLAPEESLADLAVLKKNGEAAKVLLAKEAQRTGKSLDEVSSEWKQLQAGLSNPQLLDKQMKQTFAGNKAASDQAKQQLQMTLMGGTKQMQADAAALKWQIVQGAATEASTQAFLDKPGEWKIADPAFNEALKTATSTKANADAGDVLAAYVGTSTGPERQAKMDMFFNSFAQAIEPRTKSLLAPVNADFVKQRLIAGMNRKSIADKLQDDNSLGNTMLLNMNALPGLVNLKGTAQWMQDIGNFFGAKRYE